MYRSQTFTVGHTLNPDLRFAIPNPTPTLVSEQEPPHPNLVPIPIPDHTPTNNMAILTVFLDKLTNLKDADGIGKSDPYVKFKLEQDNFGPFDKDFGTQTSSKKANTLNPEYGETFSFHDLPSGLGNMVLSVTVFDEDVLKDDKIGSCKIKLFNINEDLSDFVEVVEDLDNKWFRKDAKVHLKIKFEE